MKNNEIMISAEFKSADIDDELSHLVLKDISLKALKDMRRSVGGYK